MLNIKIFSFKFFKFIQSGFYVDFILKKLSEVFVRNFFVYSSNFFGEKYIIEYLTKKIIESFIFNSNKNFFFFELFQSSFFLNFLSFFFFFISLILIFIL